MILQSPLDADRNKLRLEAEYWAKFEMIKTACLWREKKKKYIYIYKLNNNNDDDDDDNEGGR